MQTTSTSSPIVRRVDSAKHGEDHPPAAAPIGLVESLRQHWPEYVMEAAELGTFMISACLVVALLEHPASPVMRGIADPVRRRLLIGMAMGLTAIAIIYSPWGKQSGAHFNPAVTFTFWRLGKVAGWDAVFYVTAQFIGGIAGVLIASAVLGEHLAHPSVNYVATQPGTAGVAVALVAEGVLSFGLMTVVLTVSNSPRLARFTGVCCGLVVATYISIAAPLSGMSMNPARSLGPAAVSQMWNGLWIYFVAPPLGMLMAAETYVRTRRTVACAKLHHANRTRCIFCAYQHGAKGAEWAHPQTVGPMDDRGPDNGLTSER